MNRPRLARMCAGALGGFAATLPMSLLMLAGRRKNVWRKMLSHVDPLPPRQITQRTLAAIGVDNELPDEAVESLTVLNHFAYGASMGSVYGLISDRRPALTATTVGVFYGLGVWAVSYLGWLPATGLYRSATEDSDKRNLRMIAAHVVWGGTMGYVTEMTSRRITNSEPSRPAINRVNCSHRAETRRSAKPR